MNAWLEPPKPYVLGPAGDRQRERLLRVVLDAGALGLRVEAALEDRLGLSRLEILILAGELDAAGQIRLSWRLPQERLSAMPCDPLERLCMERYGVEPFLFPRRGAAAPTELEMLAGKAPRYGFASCDRPRRRQRRDLREALAQVARACGAEAALYVQTARGLSARFSASARRRLARVARRDTCIVLVLDVRGPGRLEAGAELASAVRSCGYSRALAVNARGAALLAAVGLHEWAAEPEAKLGPLAGVGLDARPGETPEARVEGELTRFGWPAAGAHALAARLAAARDPISAGEIGGPAPTPAERAAVERLRGLRPDGDAVVAVRA